MTSPAGGPEYGHALSGRQLGRYLIGEQLGSGGVAAVYRALDQVDQRAVALKVLPPTADAAAMTRFRREAFTAGGLRHPNIVRTLQVGTPAPGELAYIAMELIDGGNLGDLLAARGRLRVDEGARLLRPIADALAFAHAAGVVHRDVKPSNILLRPAEAGATPALTIDGLDAPVTPMLTDFGVALALDSPELTGVGHTVGTPAYMAPEQCAGQRRIDGRADIYALGVVFYRCVVGHLPFGGTTTQILHAHVYEPLRIPDALLRQLPPIVIDILRQSMAKAPAERYADATAMARDLAVAGGESQPGAHPPPATVSGDDATATGTMTMASLPSAPSTPPSSGSVIVPATGSSTALSAPASVNREAPAATTPPTKSTAGRSAVNWLGLLVLAGALAAGLGLAALVVTTGLWPPGAANSARTPSRPMPPITDSGSGIGGAAAAGAASMTPPTAAVAPEATQQPASAAALAATPTSTAPAPTATQAPTLLPTVPPTEVPAPPTAAPTEPPATLPPTMAPTPSPTPAGVFNCAALVDPFFLPFLAGLENSIAQQFTCPSDNATDATGTLLRFERGFMLQLDNDPAILIYYDLNQEWERAVSTWQDGDPPLTGDFPPPGPDLHQPAGPFGRLWAAPQRQAALGYATMPQPEQFPAVSQSFPGGTLTGDRDSGAVYLFLRERLRL